MKDPGPFCKKCYHKHISPGRQKNRRERSQAEPPDEFAAYREMYEYLDYLGLEHLGAHMSLESFHDYMGMNNLRECEDYDDLPKRAENDLPQRDSADDEEIPF